MQQILTEMPSDLPRPIDDGAADHLQGRVMPEVSLSTTSGDAIHLHQLQTRTVLFVYPMTGRPDTPLPEGWDQMPGARGCTPQSCAYRDNYNEFRSRDIEIFGVSSQSSAYQAEARDRLHLPYELLSDEGLCLKGRLGLPTFEAHGVELYRRLTLVIRDGVIEKYFYPVFPPGDSAHVVLEWLDQLD